MAELPNILYAEIQQLCARGDELAKAGECTAALREFDRAWKLLPTPKEHWSAATWILAAIGDTQFAAGNFTAAHEVLLQAMACPEGFGNPFLHLRLGQTEFELGNHDQAANELTRAYGLDGAWTFESEDPKYFDFLKTRIREPRGGWEW